MPIMDSTPKKRGATLSNLEVANAVSKIRKPSDSKDSRNNKKKRRNSVSHNTTNAVTHQDSPKIEGLLPPQRRKKPLPDSKSSPNSLIAQTVTPEITKKKRKFKEQFSGFFKSSKGSSGSRLSDSLKNRKLSKEKYDKNSVLTIQCFWRSIMVQRVKKIFNTRSNINSYEKTLKELLQNEEHYIETLTVLKDHYFLKFPALLKKHSSILGDINIKNLFPGLDYTIACHSSFVKQLRICVSNIPFIDVTIPLLDHVKLLTKIYENLPSSLQQSENILQKLLNIESFSNFCNETSLKHPKSLQKRSIRYLISSPLSYMYRFEEICKLLLIPFQQSIQLERLFDVESISTQLSSYLQEQIEIHDCEKMINFFTEVCEKNKSTSCIIPPNPKRRFLRDRLTRINSKKGRIYLFSDIIVLFHIKSNSSPKFIGNYFLKDLKVTKSRRSVRSKGIDCSYTLHVLNLPEKLSFRCKESSTSTSSSLIILLEDFILRNNDPVFGISLKNSMENNNNLPTIFRKTIYHLDKNPDKSKLFRKPANTNAVTQLRINEANKSNDISGSHRDDIAGLLITFLELLPDTFIDFSCILSIPNIPKQLETGNTRRIIKGIIQEVSKLPKEQQIFLEYLTYFLARLVSSNKLTTRELAYIFTPFIIQCKNERDIEYSRNMPILIRICELIIQKRHKIFILNNKENKLPKDIEDFFDSDPFGEYWKLFRENSKSFIRFITLKESVIQLFKYLISYPNDKNYYKELSASILTTDIIANKIIENGILLDELFIIINDNIKEENMKWIFHVIVHFFHLDSKKMCDYLLFQNQEGNSKLIKYISSGNISTFLEDIIVKSITTHELYPLLTSWCILAFDQILISEFSFSDNTLFNSVNFLCTTLREEAFLASESFNDFRKHLTTSKLKEFISLSLNKTKKKIACQIHKVISALIVLKDLSLTPQIPIEKTDNDDSDNNSESSLIVSGLRQGAANWTEHFEDENSIEDDDDSDENSSSFQEQLEIASESSFNSSVEEEDSPSRAKRFSRSSSFSSLRWSECYGSITQTTADIKRTNLLTLFISNHEKITNILLDKTDSNKTIFGEFRLGIIQLIQVTVFTGDSTITQQLTKSKILSACIEVFFSYPTNNIMHHIIEDIISGILQQNNDSLIFNILLDTQLINYIIKILQDPNFEYLPSHGHILLIINAIKSNVTASTWIKNSKLSSDWNKHIENLTNTKK